MRSYGDLNVSRREINRLEENLVGEKKYPYYRRQFDQFELHPNRKFSFNLAGFAATFFWAFYRGLYLAGGIGLLLTLVGVYLVAAQDTSQLTPLVVLGNALTILPNVFFGFFGNRLYYDNLTPLIHEGLLLPRSKQEAFFKEYAGGNVRIVLGLLFAFVFAVTAIMLSLSGT